VERGEIILAKSTMALSSSLSVGKLEGAFAPSKTTFPLPLKGKGAGG